MEDSVPLLTLSEVKAMIDMRDNITKEDTLLRLLIAAATDSIEAATGRLFSPLTHTEYLTTRENRETDYNLRPNAGDWHGGINIFSSGLQTIRKPTAYYLVGVNVDPDTMVVHYNPNAVDDADYNDDALLDESHYELDGDKLTILTGTRYAPRGLRIQYSAGFEAAPEDPQQAESETNPLCLSASIPQALKMAAITQVMFLRTKLRTSNIGLGVERLAVEGKRSTMQAAEFLSVTGLTPEVWPYLARYKRTRTGRG